jgi:hypothetical protein
MQAYLECELAARLEEARICASELPISGSDYSRAEHFICELDRCILEVKYALGHLQQEFGKRHAEEPLFLSNSRSVGNPTQRSVRNPTQPRALKIDDLL